MATRGKLLESIASIVSDYREDDLDAPTPDHVSCWVAQFDPKLQLSILEEMKHLLDYTYFSKQCVSDFFKRQINNEKLTGRSPCEFWKSCNILDIQENGQSQSELIKLFGNSLLEVCGLEVEECGERDGAYIYIDDVLFTGGRIGDDLESWIKSDAPEEATVHILVIGAHRFGKWKCSERLKFEASEAGKKINFHWWAAIRIENRMRYKNVSEVLWPAVLPEDADLKAYIEEEKKFPFEVRQSKGFETPEIFSSENGRELLEREFLLAGLRIRNFCEHPKKVLRPLGYSPFGLGFGSTIVTYRNCPNNCPLALWWGDPNASQDHPFSKWFPLFPRKTYEKDMTFEDFDF